MHAQSPLSQEAQAHASSSHLAHEQEERGGLETPLTKKRIEAGIEASIEARLRAYCNRPSVTKRFPQIHFPSLDYSALAKRDRKSVV